MKFKLKFQQYVNGTEDCEAIIEADDVAGALEKYHQREFKTYLIMKQDAERKLVEDFQPEITIVRET